MNTARRKEYYTAEEHEVAKTADIVSYLQSIGYGLKQEGKEFKGVQHDSLIIRNDGRWYWNSRGIGGKSPIELLRQVLINDYGYSDDVSTGIEAIKRLAAYQGFTNDAGAYNSFQNKTQTQQVAKNNSEQNTFVPIELPEVNKTFSRVMAYLCNARGIEPDIVKDLMKQKKLYESKDYHNAVFVSRDNEGTPRYAFVRGTLTSSDKQFKKELLNSDKSFAFTLPGYVDSDRVFCFEAAIDAMSHATLYKMNGLDWKKDDRIALGGTSFLGLERFLKENPKVNHITVCLDNDPTGQRRGLKIEQEYKEKGYHVDFEYPKSKDFNQDLIEERQKENEEQEDEFEY